MENANIFLRSSQAARESSKELGTLREKIETRDKIVD